MTAQVKFTTDEYPGGYANGLSMLDSGTMGRFKTDYEDDDRTVLKTEDGITLTSIHRSITPSGFDSAPFDRNAKTCILPTVRCHETTICNGSDHPVTMEMITSFCLQGVKADKLYRMSSFWSAEGRLRVDRLADLNLERSWAGHGTRVEKFGTVGSMPVRGFFPFVALEDSESGRFTAATLYTPSSWQIEIMMRRTPELTLAGGIADADFGHWTKTLQPGESFTAPRALTAEGRSLLEVCDLLLKAQTPDISPVDDRMGISFNEYCTTWGDPTIDNMKKICDKLADKNIQYLVMDSGWYLEKGQYWWDHIGKWEVNTTRFPNGLRELTDYVRGKGMIPGIWFEPESVAWGCELYSKPEYLLCKNGVPITVGGKRFFDMENKFVRDYLRQKVIGLLRENNFGYIKIDYNDTIGIGCEGYESLGEGLRRKLLASQDFFRELKRELPDLVIENCSSGGHRLEPSMMELSSMASFSDAHEPLCVPLIAANLLRLVRSEQNQIWAVLRKTDTDARIYYSLCSTFMGRIGMSGDIYDLSDHRWELIDQGLAFYREAADIIRYGTTTAIETTADSYNTPTGYQYTVKEYSGRLLVIAHRFADDIAESTYLHTIPALDALISAHTVLSEYGDLSAVYSAKAWILN